MLNQPMKDLLADFETAILSLDATALHEVQMQAQQLGPASEQLILGLGLMHDGHANSARDCFEQALKHEPSEGVLYRLVAMTYLSVGDFAQAEPHIRSAVERDDDFEAWCQLGMILSNLERWDEAIVAYEIAIERGDPKGFAAFALGSVRLRRGEPVQALETLAVALPKHPNPETIYQLLWSWAQSIGSEPGALILSHITRDGTHEPEAFLLMDVMVLQLRLEPESLLENRAEAEKIAARLFACSDEIPAKVRLFISKLLQTRGLEQQAELFQGTLSEPDLAGLDAAEFHLLQAQRWVEQGKNEKALASYRRSIASAHYPEDTLLARTLALRLLLTLDDESRIATEYGALLEGLPPWLNRTHDQLLVLEAICLHRLDNASEARELLDRVGDKPLRDDIRAHLWGQ